MKNYFKKFSIMFVMLLSIIGVGTIQNETVVNAATVGQQLTSPEDGWKRYDDNNSNISYEGSGWYKDLGQYCTQNVLDVCYNKTVHYSKTLNTDIIKFNFTGDKIRIITFAYTAGHNSDVKIKIDNTIYSYNESLRSTVDLSKQILVFENKDLDNKEHSVQIYENKNNALFFSLDAVDIDSTGELKPYNENIESISLDKSSMDLVVGDSHSLVATTTPAGAQVTWKSSDESVAKVDQNGNVTAVGEGNCIITATINDGSNLSDSCTINVTKKDTTEPTEPDNAKAILIINLTDGETKVFDVSYSEVSKFKQWYNTKSEFENKLTYEFNKTVNSNISIEEDVVHDQITSYEIRKY